MRMLIGVVVASILAVWAGPSAAASLQVSPIRVEIPHNEVSRPLWASNTGSDPIQVQVQVFRWTQVNGQDVLEPTEDLVATPAMGEVAPGGRQLIRLVRQIEAPSQEQAYRLRVEELPVKGVERKDRPALTLLLAYSLPVFLTPAGQVEGEEGKPAAPPLTIVATHQDVTITNTGTTRAMISDLTVTSASGQTQVVRSGLVGYVLAGQTMVFSFPTQASAVSVGATVNQNDQLRWTIAP